MMIKAVNPVAVGIEISRKGEKIHFVCHLWKGIGIRANKRVSLALIKPILKLQKFIAHFRKHIIVEREIPVTVIWQGLIRANPEIEYNEDDKGILIRVVDDKLVYVNFSPPVDGYRRNLVVVPKTEFLEVLNKLLE